MTNTLDPKTDSALIRNYPSQLVGDGNNDDAECLYPGCDHTALTFARVLEHIKIEHPFDEIACQRCKVKTRLEGKKWCEDCIEICEPKQISDEEIAESRGKTEAAMKRCEEHKLEDPAAADEATAWDEKMEEEKMTKPYQKEPRKCPKCGVNPLKKWRKMCDDCAGKSAGAAPKKKAAPSSEGLLYEAEMVTEETPMMDGRTLHVSLLDDKAVKVWIE